VIAEGEQADRGHGDAGARWNSARGRAHAGQLSAASGSVGHRAGLVLHPRIVVCDEPTSALDVSVGRRRFSTCGGIAASLD